MSEGPNFLSRWSRRKREAEAKRAAAPLDTALPSDAGEPATGVGADEDSQVGLPDLTPEELAALPRLEDLTPETDLAPFMRGAVPAGLRNAALRRMWALDPAIRDRVGDALDYAYDWSVPGSVPGSGPLLPVDDVTSMLRSIMGGPAEEQDGADQIAKAETPVAKTSSAPQPAADPPEQERLALAQEPAADSQVSASPASAKPDSEMRATVSSPRRHGGATPF